MSEGKRVALYARASSDVQEHSIPGQVLELRAHAVREGFEVVEVVEDLGEKRHTLDRPGIDRVRDLAETGAVTEVWAWEWSRYGEFPVPEVLAVELRDYGVELRSLDDGGGGEDGEDGEDMQVIKSLFSRREQRDRVRRANRGRSHKALRGEVFGGFRARYGLRFVKGRNKNRQEVNVGYEVDPEQMAVVRRIFEAVAAGGSLKGIRRELEQAGIPNPSGGTRWSTTTIKGIVQDDVFRPHAVEEVEAMLATAPVAANASLEAGRSYGVHWSGRKRSRFKSSRGKARVVYETPPDQWVPIPVDITGAGLERAVVDLARARVAENRPSAKVGERFWELSGGVLKCGECGRNMIAYRRAKKSGFNFYYRCRPSSSLDLCPNRKSHPAEDLEYVAAKTFQTYASRETLLELYDEAVEQQSGGRSGRTSMERRAALVEKLAECEQERRGYLRQNARGVLSDSELDTMLAEVEERRREFDTQMRAVEDEAEAARQIEAARYSLVTADYVWDPDAIQPREYLTLAAYPEEVRSAYARYGARFTVDKEGELQLRLELPLEGGALHLPTTS